jgi:hypothetical protein
MKNVILENQIKLKHPKTINFQQNKKIHLIYVYIEKYLNKDLKDILKNMKLLFILNFQQV